MNPQNIEELARKVDRKAREENYGIADLQHIRAELQDHRKRRAYPSIDGDRTCIFGDESIKENYAYHYGGRNELQFNLKIREYDEDRKVRYGVAFRLQPSQYRNIEKPIRRRVRLFNQYLNRDRDELDGLGLGMWYSRKIEGEKTPSRVFRPHKISGRLLGRKITVVLGKREKPSALTYADILSLYDKLLTVYEYIERNLSPEVSFDSDTFSPSPTHTSPITDVEQSETVLKDDLNPASIDEIAHAVNEQAEAYDYAIADLQDIRMDVKDDDLPDRPDQKPTSEIFRVSDFSDDYVFHCGGRNELQFNLALRRFDGVWKVRYGVAFLYKLGRGMESLAPMRLRIRNFNEYLRGNPEKFTGLKLWYEPKGSREPRGDYQPREIPESLLESGTFFFLGRRKKPSEIDYDDILHLFDRLLPLYKYVERNLNPENFSEQEDSSQAPDGKHLSTDNTYESTAERSKTVVSVERTHDWMRDVLAKRLALEHGTGNVHVEAHTEQGRSVDLVVQTEDGKWFYELKPFSEPRLCLRRAIGQLLEYAYWSDSEPPERLIVVGKSELEEEGRAYLSTLKERFSLPLEYQSVQVG
jgi:hypothetical protein